MLALIELGAGCKQIQLKIVIFATQLKTIKNYGNKEK